MALYHYNPSAGTAGLFTVLFAIITLLHSYQVLRTRTWIFIPFIIGGIMEAVGYVGRIISAGETPNWTLGPYIMQTLLLLSAPALFAASIYMVLGRVIALTQGERYSLIRQKWLTKIFVAGDVLSFLVQAADLGQTIVVVGLAIQVIVFGLFVVVAVLFHRRMLRSPTEIVRSNPTMPWQKHLYALYGTSVVIWVRSIFRLIEFAQGRDGYLMSMEIWLYIFDSLLMFAIMVWLAVVHPSEVYALLKGGKNRSIYKVFFVRQMPPLEAKAIDESSDKDTELASRR